MQLLPGTRVGAYEILSALGAGGMGEVYRAHDERLNRGVALKILPASVSFNPERVARFKREAQVLASLSHPNIAIVHGFEHADGIEALVMELAEGPTLAERIAQGPIAIHEALPIAKQIAEALEAAHEQGIIHRDLKPANIKLRSDATVKVLDFGLAKVLEPLPTEILDVTTSPTITSPAMMTGVGIILGTAAYMAPEQAKGRPADKRSDVWAFGCVLYEMLAGKRAFEGEDVSDTLAMVLKGEPKWDALPAATPPAIHSLLHRCLRKDQRRRLQSVGDARLEIDDALVQPDGSDVTTDTLSSRPSRRVERLAWAAATAAGVLLIGLVALTWAHLHTTADGPPLHLSIALPDDAEVGSLALSPDGRSVVLAAAIGGAYQLWIRKLDSTELRPLSGTALARLPFWSPDSRSIGFFADRKLKTIAATGGPSRVLCELIAVGGGGTWSRDGTILFGLTSLGGQIYRVQATGGECEPLTKPEGGSAHSLPEFLPDGRHFFYLVTLGNESTRGVYVASLDDPHGERVVRDQSSVAYVSPSRSQPHGFLLFLRESTLMAQPFDARTLHAVGDAVPVTSHASQSQGASQMAASTSASGTVVFLANGPFSSAGQQLAWFARGGKELAKVGAQRRMSGVALAPDDKTVLVGSEPGDPAGSQWLIDLGLGRNMSSRFSPPGAVGVPVWSPDSKRVAIGRLQPGSSVDDLYWKDVGSTDETIVLKNDNRKYPSDWSRDGRYLIYTELDPKTGPDIWALDVSDASAVPKPFAFVRTPFTESQGQISPDGHWLAYVSDESGQFEVYVRPFPSGNGRWLVSNAGGRDPRWRRDGKELFYLEGTTGRYRLMTLSTTMTGSSAPMFDLPTPIFELRTRAILPPLNIFAYAPSGDGERFLFQRFPSDVHPTLDVLMNWQTMLPAGS